MPRGRRQHLHHRLPASVYLLSQPAAALVLAGYATAALPAGTALLSRRDIT